MAPMIDPASSIPELIAFIRYSFRECEYDEVRNILIEREKSMKAEMGNLMRDREQLKKQVLFLEKSKGFTELEKLDLEEKLGRSQRRVGELEKTAVEANEKFDKLKSEKEDFEEKLARSGKKWEELEGTFAQTKEKCDKLVSEKEDVEEKLLRSSERCEEMNVRLVEMGKEIEELRRESLSANKTIQELKAKEIEADRLVQELQRKNVEAVQTIDELRANKMKSDKAAESYENDLDPRILKLERALAKMLSVNVEDLADLANGVDGSAAVQLPAVSGSPTSATAMQSGGEVPTEKTAPSSSAAGNVLILISDSDSDDETSVPDALSGQTNKRDRTDSGEVSPMNFVKRRNISTSATPSRCTSLPNGVEERAGALQKSHTIDCVDSTDSDDEVFSDAYMNNLVASGLSKRG